MNGWIYTYDALGQLKTQVDGKTQQTSISYDLLGRMTGRATTAFTSNWFYDKYANNAVCNKGVGKLCEVTTTNGFRRTFLYHSLGRGLETTTFLNSIPYSVTNTYGGCINGVGKVCGVTYPFTYGAMARVKVNNVYNTLGYLTSIQDATNNAALWSLNGPTAIDALGNITKETLGNGLVTDRAYSSTAGRIQTIKTGNSLVQNLAYGFDQLGDLTSRDDGVNNVHETFTYDALNRLTNTAMTGATALTKSYGYSSIGNLTTKSDVGTLVYPVTGVQRHAVQSVTGTVNGLVNPTYEYDTVGNLLREKTGTTILREITWTGFNMPSRIAKGSSTIDFVYDADHARVYEARKTGAVFDSQTYFVNAGNSLFFEIETKGAVTEWKHYLHAPSGLLMMRSIKSNSAAKTDVYFHKDHLGSITTITNHIGAILEQNSFDAFGKRRNSNGSDATTTINSLTRRGFTEHEMLPEVNMIHMNGRVYEPTLGRFMSADPIVQDPEFSQSFNRYSYVMNNPLSLTDPDGYIGVPQLEVEIVIGHREAPIVESSSSGQTYDGGSGGGGTGDFGPWSKPYPNNGLSAWENMALRYNQFMRGEFYPLLPMGNPVSIAEGKASGLITPAPIYQGGHYVREGDPFPEFLARQGVAKWGGGTFIKVAGGNANNNNNNRARAVEPSLTRSIEEPIATGRVVELVKEIQTFNPRFTYEVIGGGYRQTDVVRLQERLQSFQRSANQGMSVLRLDRTGKVHGEIPSYVPRNAIRESLRELSVDLRISIETRRTEQRRLGEDGPHRERIRQEEQLLRQVDKILGGS